MDADTLSRNPLSSQVISNILNFPGIPKNFLTVVIPYQVRSYQTRGPFERGTGTRPVVIPYQVRSYQTDAVTEKFVSLGLLPS